MFITWQPWAGLKAFHGFFHLILEIPHEVVLIQNFENALKQKVKDKP